MTFPSADSADVLPLPAFNGLPDDECERELLACCASPPWAARVAAGRPYGTAGALAAASDAALAELDWEQVEAALAAHPRIGERAAGADRAAAWSRREQSGADDAGSRLQAELVEGNRAYEERFGHVFLICATGRSAAEMLAALRERLGNDPAAERPVVREELRRITRIRLGRLVGPTPPEEGR
ncbi:2-oxo-4-hydroxy-4-carboxy-5-ureidoimidazoline decarboxylase [Allonocardiopsis opalescens]|uniref:2-oxo-4-hydroxy-4-carboxy-5-ureidoimidazoline decarboxylase n=1 Tax=Allonocardiopsis opalescens TaxID=1144618 RepID=A0A2T0QCN4_9ACTN|nr:2-oxo-4-hydroxy-4-carboxy-5-ureidoimidazoline decarboxylase [Allonocardiopsis opalescens]PRY01665.1 2-oxo-4-hydroxy-4-carboxy-5-ureidoimidazoline decarboxylase [Allonocardiopsis opalescens]